MATRKAKTTHGKKLKAPKKLGAVRPLLNPQPLPPKPPAPGQI